MEKKVEKQNGGEILRCAQNDKGAQSGKGAQSDKGGQGGLKSADLQENIKSVKSVLTSEDILVFEFESEEGKKFAAVFADGIVDKALLGELAVKPLRAVKKDGKYNDVKLLLATPEVKDGKDIAEAIKEVCGGNAVLFIDGETDYIILGLKSPVPERASSRT